MKSSAANMIGRSILKLIANLRIIFPSEFIISNIILWILSSIFAVKS